MALLELLLGGVPGKVGPSILHRLYFGGLLLPSLCPCRRSGRSGVRGPRGVQMGPHLGSLSRSCGPSWPPRELLGRSAMPCGPGRPPQWMGNWGWSTLVPTSPGDGAGTAGGTGGGGSGGLLAPVVRSTTRMLGWMVMTPCWSPDSSWLPSFSLAGSAPPTCPGSGRSKSCKVQSLVPMLTAIWV